MRERDRNKNMRRYLLICIFLRLPSPAFISPSLRPEPLGTGVHYRRNYRSILPSTWERLSRHHVLLEVESAALGQSSLRTQGRRARDTQIRGVQKCGWHYQLVYILYTYSIMELCNISRTCNVYIKCIFFNFSFLYRLFSANIF